MDLADKVRLETYEADKHRETDHRRTDLERDRDGDISNPSPTADDYESPWDDERGRERMAEACYDC